MSNSIKFLLTLIILTSVSACSPLRFDMYVRNFTNETAFLSLLYNSQSWNSIRSGVVRYRDSLLEINDQTTNKLQDTLKVSIINDNKMSIEIPPQSTIFLSDMVYSVDEFSDKTLIIKSTTKTDSLNFNYPHKKIKGVKYKRNSAFNFFYRTILYYDIPQA